ARVLRVDNDGTLILKDGRQAVAEGIRLPQGRADHAPDYFVTESLAALRDLVVGKTVTLKTLMPDEDRYGRLRAQITADGKWVQGEMLAEGLARVSLSPARTECSTALYGLEEKARVAKAGLWASQDYAVRTPDKLWHDLGTFQVVEGKVLNASVHGGRAYLNFGADWRTDFTVTIAPDDMKSFRKEHIDPRDYAGKFVRVRGFLDWQNGPEIATANPEGIEQPQNKKPELAPGPSVALPMKC
ncbi:MAG TPA: thermonuclease family protein, partial [Rhizomicrobium sp.]|nr:thermonuclease family protein [Rhizomicrobium sp.]